MKKTYWFNIFSEDACKKLLCYVLLPLLVIALMFIKLDKSGKERTLALPFRVPDDVLTSSLGVFEKAGSAVVLIKTFDKKGSPEGAGTGFFISSKGQLITNNHVIAGVYSAIAINEEGKVYPIKGLIAKDKDTDLVKLLADVGTEDVAFLELSKALPGWGDKTWVIGHPGAGVLTLSVGKVHAGSENGRISHRCVRYEISAPVSPGSSGSPVLDPNVRVIGVAQSCKFPASYKNSYGGVSYVIATPNISQLKDEDKLVSLPEYASSDSSVSTKRWWYSGYEFSRY